MNKIYVLTDGVYSEYRIVGVFDDKEKAIRFRDYYNEGDSRHNARIEEYPLNSDVDKVDQGYDYYFILMAKNGDIKSCKKDTPSTVDTNISKDTKGNYIGHVWAKDQVSAIKIMNERRIQEKAK